MDVSDFGGTVREYQVRVDPNKLVSYGLSIGQVEQQLANNNINAGGSFVEVGLQQMNVRALGLFSNVHDIEQTVLKTQTGTALRVKDIAEVVAGSQRSDWATWREPTTWRTGALSTSPTSFRAWC